MSLRAQGLKQGNGLWVVMAMLLALFASSAEAAYTPLTIHSQPGNTTVYEGDAVKFTINATSSRIIRYTWYKNGNVVGTNSNTLSVSSASAANAGTFTCRVTDRKLTKYCTPFTFTVLAKATTPVSDLKLISQPVNTTLYEGKGTTFTMSVTSSRPVTYTWLKNGSVIGSGSSLSISNATLSSAGTYSCRATDTIATINCSSFTLSINQIVRITQQPTSQMLNEGGSASLSVSATGTAPISYQWYRNGSAISGATSNTLSFASTIMDNAGAYYCRVSNPGSTVNSASATLSIVAAVRTGSALISWQAPTRRADGSTLTADQIAGYELFHSADSASGLTKLTSLGKSELSIVVDDLAAGTHYFALATKDVSGLQSAMSSTITVTIP